MQPAYRQRAYGLWGGGRMERGHLLTLHTWWGYQLTKTVQNGGAQAISEILQIEYRIVCCIETYLIHIYHMSPCN